jgi:hypothetical protein
MNKKIICVISLTTFFIIACKKHNADNQETTIEIKFSSDALVWVQLPLNRYFIYKDSATAALDSVVVTQSNLDTKFVPAHKSTGYLDFPSPAFYYQDFTLILTSFTGTTSNIWLKSFATTQFNRHFSSMDTSLLNLNEINSGNNAYKNSIFLYPIIPASYPLQTISMIPQLTIEGKIYNNVGIFIISNTVDTSQSYYLKTTYYWVKGTEIIKREVRTSTTLKTDLLVRNG